MPCSSAGYEPDDRSKLTISNMHINALEAMLCHAFTVAEQQILNAPLEVYVECGTKRVTMQAWWDNHKAEDEKRRQREAKEKADKLAAQEIEGQRKRDKEERQRVLDAMTPEVRRLFESLS